MKNAYILHGVCDAHEYYEMDFPSPSNAHWLPWLQQKFLRADVLCQCLEMPSPYNPNYTAWLNNWQQARISSKTTIVGHSAGCGFMLKWLSENSEVHLDKLVLVAPWLDPNKKCGDFLECILDESVQTRVNELHVLYSQDEPVDGVKQTVELIVNTYPNAKLHKFTTYGHFCLGHMDTNQFPELWDIVK